MRTLSLSIAGLIVLLSSAPMAAQTEQVGWPYWRGPDRDGISKETGWVIEGKAEYAWNKNVGMGYSTVSIQAGRLYTQGHDKDAQRDSVFCLEAKTGKEIWKHTFPAKTWNQGHRGGTLSTPSIDGDRVYALNREGKFFCFDAAKGKIHWSKNLKKAYGLKLPRWGFAAAPMIFDDMIVMNVGHVLALNKTGKLIWKTSKNYGDAYATPAEFKHKGKSALASFSGDGFVALTRKSGKELAFHKWTTKYNINAATPIVIDDRVFISSGYNHGCAMLKLTGQKPKVLWESRVMRNQMSGCVLYKKHLYGFDDGTLKCLDLAGSVKWAQRGLGKGALVIADGKILALSTRGHLVIADASPNAYKELSRRKVLSGGVYWTTPVLLDGFIYCRNSNGDLVCLDHRKSG